MPLLITYRYVYLLLASSERAWSSALAMKSAQSAETTQKAMRGSTKRQIVSRLRRGITFAENLVQILKDQSAKAASTHDVVEAQAYLSLLKGTLNFEKAHWEACIRDFSLVRLVYSTLGSSAGTDVFKDLLSSTVDPSIRYAAYQLKLPRTKPISQIAIEHFPNDENETRREVESLNPEAFDASGESTVITKDGTRDLPSTLSWRTRTVKIEDAAISQALGAAIARENGLSSAFKNFNDGNIEATELAAAYDNVINARQDAVDATKTAIDELTAEGVDQSDKRMQSLQVTRTAVNYAVIEWRVGRNRVLCGPSDGMLFEPRQSKMAPKPRKDGKKKAVKEESIGRKLARLRERVALYDATLQSLDAVRELPGVAADTSFVEELASKRGYFRALK